MRAVAFVVPRVRPLFSRPGRFRHLFLVIQTKRDHSDHPSSSATGHLGLSTAVNEPCELGHADSHPGCAAHGGRCASALGGGVAALRPQDDGVTCAHPRLAPGGLCALTPASPRLLWLKLCQMPKPRFHSLDRFCEAQLPGGEKRSIQLADVCRDSLQDVRRIPQ